MLGLYKWVGNTLYITWFDHDATSNQLTIIEMQGALDSNGELTNIQIGDNNRYTFVKQGETRQYKRNLSETLQVTFGSNEAIFNGDSVTLNIGFRSTTFEYNGYIYTLKLNANYTFSYTTEKITVITSYTAEDGSTLTVYDGKIVTANGRIKNVDGNGLELFTETQGWYLTKVTDNVYWFRIDYLTYKYFVEVTLNPDDNTFSYTSSLGASLVTYTDNAGNHAIVTKDSSGNVTSINILFKTATGGFNAVTTFEKTGANTYTVTVDEQVTDYDEEGNPFVRDSEFNGTYTLTLNSDGVTFTLVKLD